ncbi:MAG: AAA family ATPase [Methylococcaceae bacterium]|nr:AAA family ATPase [Methylococcaceae bacterium]
MLIRFVVNNVLSFGKEKEFNMLPMPRLKRLNEHKYNINDFEILKIASIYGANGAGKSNLIHALFMLQNLIKQEELSLNYSNSEFKFNRELGEKPLTFVIEYFQDNKSFLYGIEILNNTVITEELYESGLGKKEDKLLFERKTNVDTKETKITSELFEESQESKTLKKVIEKNLSKPDKIIFRNLTTFNEPYLKDIETAIKWFDETLQIVTPDAKPSALSHKIDIEQEFKKYAEDTMKSFNIGIESIKCQKKTLKEFFGEDDLEQINNIKEKLGKSAENLLGLRNKNSDEIIISKEDDEYYVKKLQIEHKGQHDIRAMFDLDEESDGTVRLLDFIPAFQSIIHKNKVFIIDEIERSIHPLLIKELIKKFSEDTQTNGQLIFTTHESNLLDQDIFRQDEIWFAEKDNDGCSDLYSLSDFKEHSTIDIRKGYLTGRYGSIPFLANLKDLNWHEYATKT